MSEVRDVGFGEKKESRVTLPALCPSVFTLMVYHGTLQLVRPPEKDCHYTSVLDCVKTPSGSSYPSVTSPSAPGLILRLGAHTPPLGGASVPPGIGAHAPVKGGLSMGRYDD